MNEAFDPVWTPPILALTSLIPFFSSPLSFPLCWGEDLRVVITSLVFEGYPVTQRPCSLWAGDSVPALNVIGYRKPDPGDGM